MTRPIRKVPCWIGIGGSLLVVRPIQVDNSVREKPPIDLDLVCPDIRPGQKVAIFVANKLPELLEVNQRASQS